MFNKCLLLLSNIHYTSGIMLYVLYLISQHPNSVYLMTPIKDLNKTEVHFTEVM